MHGIEGVTVGTRENKSTISYIIAVLGVILGLWWLRTDAWVGIGWIAVGVALLVYLIVTGRRGGRRAT
jgi:hypothetical protein